jgi:hypothetical protein
MSTLSRRGAPREERSLIFNRREADRFDVIGEVEATRLDALGPAAERRLLLALIDESVTGVGARTDTPVAPGAQVRVRSGAGASWRSGRVVRCVPAGAGYRVGIAFDRARAA